MTIRLLIASLGAALLAGSLGACAKDRFPPEDEGSEGDGTSTGGSTGSSSPEDTDAKCSDGIDNDNNGYTDCFDSDCKPDLNPGVTVCKGDGSPEDTDAKCSDGIDNDNNGYTDCGDFGCSKNPAVTVCGKEDTDALCSDDEDNDGDGYTDCDDYNCSQNPEVTVCQ